MSAFPPIQPAQTATGNVEVALPWNGDFSLQANNDLVLALDPIGAPLATTQRVTRLLYTNPRIPNAAGTGYLSAGDDMFHPSYGVGLPARVGSMFPGGVVANRQQISSALAAIQAMAARGLSTDPSILQNPPPTASVNPDATNISQVDVNITCSALNGQVIVVPSLPVSGAYGS